MERAQKSRFPASRDSTLRDLFLSQTIRVRRQNKEIRRRRRPTRSPAGAASRAHVTIQVSQSPDYFLLNSYAGEPRTTFSTGTPMVAARTTGRWPDLSWTWGGLVELNQKRWALRAG